MGEENLAKLLAIIVKIPPVQISGALELLTKGNFTDVEGISGDELQLAQLIFALVEFSGFSELAREALAVVARALAATEGFDPMVLVELFESDNQGIVQLAQSVLMRRSDIEPRELAYKQPLLHTLIALVRKAMENGNSKLADFVLGLPVIAGLLSSGNSDKGLNPSGANLAQTGSTDLTDVLQILEEIQQGVSALTFTTESQLVTSGSETETSRGGAITTPQRDDALIQTVTEHTGTGSYRDRPQLSEAQTKLTQVISNFFLPGTTTPEEVDALVKEIFAEIEGSDSTVFPLNGGDEDPSSKRLQNIVKILAEFGIDKGLEAEKMQTIIEKVATALGITLEKINDLFASIAALFLMAFPSVEDPDKSDEVVSPSSNQKPKKVSSNNFGLPHQVVKPSGSLEIPLSLTKKMRALKPDTGKLKKHFPNSFKEIVSNLREARRLEKLKYDFYYNQILKALYEKPITINGSSFGFESLNNLKYEGLNVKDFFKWCFENHIALPLSIGYKDGSRLDSQLAITEINEEDEGLEIKTKFFDGEAKGGVIISVKNNRAGTLQINTRKVDLAKAKRQVEVKRDSQSDQL
ncbi:MAG TPA: hypothetical protein V6C96_00135, partial [Vampirovibrionales bacterium]